MTLLFKDNNGLTPFEPRMLKMQMENYGAKDLEEAKMMEIKSYLKCEMKMLPSDIDKLNITSIFPPAKQDWNVLYVVVVVSLRLTPSSGTPGTWSRRTTGSSTGYPSRCMSVSEL